MPAATLNLLPELILSAGVLVLLLLTLAERGGAWARPAAVLFSLGAFAASAAALRSTGLHFHGAYEISLFSQVFKCFVTLALCAVALFSDLCQSIPDRKTVEFHLFLFTATIGMVMLASAVELLTFIVALELSSYSLYLLVMMKDYRWNSEAGLKYLILGAAASGLFLFGSGLLMGLGQSAYFYPMAQALQRISNSPAVWLGFLLAMGAFFFKLSLVPFHFWAPDAYEAAPTSATTFIATASKAAAIAVLLRWFSVLGVASVLIPVLGALAFLSMTIGNTVALVQRDTKRLLAYSSIAQAGYILVGLLSAGRDAYAAVLFYAAAYVLMNLGAFLVVLKVGHDEGTDNPSFDHFNGLADRSPLLALVLLVSLLSLAGIPPLIGFTGKWFLFAAAMKAGHGWLVLAGVVNSVVSLFYYLTIVKHAYLLKSDKKALALGWRLGVACLAVVLALVLLGVFPQPLLETAVSAFSAA